MITKFGVQNFRAFEHPIILDLAPITILTGPNNSGKSTIIRAIKLLAESAEGEDLWNILRKSSETDYQSFQNLHNRKSKSHSINFNLSFESDDKNNELKLSNVEVNLTYSTDNEYRSYGNLTSFKISDIKSGQVIDSDVDEDSLYKKYLLEEHTGEESERDYSFAKKRAAIEDISKLIKGTVYFLPTYRSKPQREYFRGSDSFLAKKLFSIQDEETPIVRDSTLVAWDSEKMGKNFRFTNKMVKMYGFGVYIMFRPNDYNGNYELHLVRKDKSETNICDLGYGVYNLISLFLLIDIAAADVRYEYKNKKSGIFQGLFASSYSKSIVLIEEPEISLHPNYQSLLADVLMHANKEYGLRFIVETHSEYLIRKIQFLIAKGESGVNTSDAIIYYFNNVDKELPPQKILIHQDGLLSEDFGSGFIDEATKTIFDLWTIPRRN